MVAAENNDAELVCRASNPWFPNDTIEDKRIISVACKYLSPINLCLCRTGHFAQPTTQSSRSLFRADEKWMRFCAETNWFTDH